MTGVQTCALPISTSGFRAFSRDAALRINILSSFSYVLETIIYAGVDNICLTTVNIRVNPQTRESRLHKGIYDYLKRSFYTILKILFLYKPFKFFSWMAMFFFFPGVYLGIRFLYFYFTTPPPTGHIQSIILSAILIFLGSQCFVVGLVASLISNNRLFIQEVLYRTKKLEIGK